MKPEEIKRIISESIKGDYDTGKIPEILENEGVSYDFGKGFTEKVIGRLSGISLTMKGDAEFRRSLNFAFYRIALTGAAAIVILLISLFLMQDSFSFNSLLGIGDSVDESIVYLITGF